MKRRLGENEIYLLYGSGEQSMKSNYKFFNSYGKDFHCEFDKNRLDLLNETPDDPIDMRFMDKLSPDFREKL